MPADTPIVRIDIPADHHPAALTGEMVGSQLGREALTGLYDTYGKINDVARSVRDKGRLASHTQPFAEAAIARTDIKLHKMRELEGSLVRCLADALTLTQHPNERSDIRAYWRSQKSAFIALAPVIATGDLATIAAVLSGPAYLSGLSNEQQATLREAAEHKIAPLQKAHLIETRGAITRVERALSHFTDTMARNLVAWRDNDHQQLEKLH